MVVELVLEEQAPDYFVESEISRNFPSAHLVQSLEVPPIQVAQSSGHESQPKVV